MRRLQILACGVSLMAATGYTTTAKATIFQATVTGTLDYGSDNLFLFGGGILPKNTPWSMTFLFNDAAPGAVISNVATIEPTANGSGLSATSGGVINGSFSWGGTSYSFGSKGGEIRREHSPGFGAATFSASGSNTGADDAWIVVSLAEYSATTALDSTDFRANLDLTMPKAVLARFEAVNYTPGVFTRTSLALGVTSAQVEALPVTAPGVPEPATWAMMLGGLGLAGWSLRQRSRRAIPAR